MHVYVHRHIIAKILQVLMLTLWDFERIGPCQWCFGVSTEVVSRNRRCQGTLAVMSCTTSSIWALLKREGQIWKEHKEIPLEYRRLETAWGRPQKRCWNNLGKKTKTIQVHVARWRTGSHDQDERPLYHCWVSYHGIRSFNLDPSMFSCCS